MIEVRTRSSGARLLCIKNDLKMENSMAFRKALEASWGLEELVVLDLMEVDFIDSSGMGVLIHAADLLKTSQRRLALLNVNKVIASVLKLSGIQAILPVLSPEEFDKHFGTG
ncbi:MAG: STAS domain-containing protein [Spirochaetales bacterium]|nr:STAS domain-containing protein [Spirochaetales bacterium]